MKRKIVINENSQLAYISDDIIKEGYRGDVELLANFNTMVLLRPGSTIKEQIESLQRLIQDLEARAVAAIRENGTIVGSIEDSSEVD